MQPLIIAASGQLARHLRQWLPTATSLDRRRLDLTMLDQIAPTIEAHAPSIIVNAAAYTGVDMAENEADIVWRINAEAPAALARCAEAWGIPLIHVSSDYVFDGRSDVAYTPETPVNPLNVYGRSKLAGELAVKSLCTRHWILRSSWVFSEFGNNFVKTMLRLGPERESLNIVSDQTGRPTDARDLARVIGQLVACTAGEAPGWGVYHAVGGPIVSWWGFAERIFQEAVSLGLLDRAPALHPVPTRAYATPAQRPLAAVLAPSEDMLQTTGVEMDWEVGLRRVLGRLA